MPPLTETNQKIRAVNVTASEVGALLGVHPYVTAGDIYDRLTGDAPAKPTTDAMTFGSEVEPILARMFRRGTWGWQPDIILNSRTYEHRRVRLCATPDALVIGRPALVEFKLSFSQNRWRDGLPPDIEWQARAQMACTHRSRVFVCVFHGTPTLYIVERESNRERWMTQAVETFWQDNVLAGVRPNSDRPEPTIVYRKERAS